MVAMMVDEAVDACRVPVDDRLPPLMDDGLPDRGPGLVIGDGLTPTLGAGWLRWVVELIADAQAPGTSADQLAALEALEAVKNVAAAAQARVAVAYREMVTETERAAGIPEARRGRGVAHAIAKARHESPHLGSRHLGLAMVLSTELPHTFAAFCAGQIDEWRAIVVARETAVLDRADRLTVDTALANQVAVLPVGALGRAAREQAYRLDPASFVNRARKAVGERRVSVRPAPDTMSWFTALLPVAHGVACLAALQQAADAFIASGAQATDGRTRDQLMVDIMVDRITGRTTANPADIELLLIMRPEDLLGETGNGTATLLAEGQAPHVLPAGIAKDLLTEPQATVFLRRLFTAPASQQLVAMESRRTRFDGLLRRFIIVRDQYCQTPWCGAPIRHIDHRHPLSQGGPTSAANGEGLCERRNLIKGGA